MVPERSGSEEEPADEVEISRRRFLKWASYVPPTMMGLIAASAEPAHAFTCNPDACNPDCNPNASCQPDINCPPNECGPDAGGCNPPSGCPPNSGCGPDSSGCGPDNCPPNS